MAFETPEVQKPQFHVAQLFCTRNLFCFRTVVDGRHFGMTEAMRERFCTFDFKNFSSGETEVFM